MSVALSRITAAVVGVVLAGAVPPVAAQEEPSRGDTGEASEVLARDPLVPGGAATAGARLGRGAPLRGASGRYVDAPLVPLGRGGGIRLGSRWVFLPSLSTSVTYDDNVDAAPSGEREDDVVGTASLRGRLQSTLARHAFGVDGVLSRNIFAGDTRPSEFNWSLGADARLDLTRRDQLDADLSYTRDQIDLTDPEQADLAGAGLVDPDEARREDRFDDLRLGVGYTRRHRDWTARVDTSIDRVAFAETDERDRLDVAAGGSFRRGIGRNLGLSVTPSYRRTFFGETPPGELDRDAQRFSLGAGADYSWPFGLRLGVTLSAVHLDFIDPDRDDETNIDVDFDIDAGDERGIPLTSRTTLTLAAGRDTDVTAAEGFATRTSTFAGADVTHVIGPTLSAGAGVEVSRDAFDGDRIDHNIDASARLSYALSRRVTTTLSYGFQKRFADDPDDDFLRNTVRLGVTVAF
jgi:opacity protein-like surface antigen